MDIYEYTLVDLLNEIELDNDTGIVITELSIPKTIDNFDREKFTDLIGRANGILKRNKSEDKAQNENTIINLIMDALKFAINILSNALIGNAIDINTPNKFKFTFTFNIKGKEKKIRLNPIKYILGGVINNLLNRLFEIAVAPARRNSMINSYKKMISSLEQLKNKAKDKETKEDCEKLIKRINKEIDYLSSNSKGDKNMKTIGEMLQESELEIERGLYDDESVTESEDSRIDNLFSILEETIDELEEACKGRSCKTEGCGSKKEGCKTEGCGSKKEGCKTEGCGSGKGKCKTEADDMEDDVDIEPDNESVIDIDDIGDDIFMI